ncbi:bifunctional glutamate N-acetyltransferase/amino-acid acetyltransferase ArgJ [Micrococcus sp. FDAARGOS_333]|uniref:bifunctional glutamate N-acetyltransferase/amino-acid acetyltransferase ArgJ n=1 Tax=Micrococcus sp. FDAARGOS_333 TaxID=1930558 RepID=UPI000B4E6FEB|nr:bifunctional glutamate N-acetyltransferase/amino-acid acetyltransferase ArgJ [Micrococcus sp. FDAARGOS_333]PNL18238.1 bifunctional glutamate N-acetyltransferase/amino-acid acetyltransferase ArgJ [Micrococcus sp. FDAARGOS_333]
MSVTAAAGFRAAGTTAGLKPSGKPDVAVVVNDGPKHEAAAVFTTNRVAAAPVLWSRQAVTDGRADAVVLNSGGANAATGQQGFRDAHRTAEHAAAALGCSSGDVLVCSTGLIGEPLDMDRLLPGVDAAVQGLGTEGGPAAAEAIMTTDTRAKQSRVDGTGYTVGGMAKGAGMLAPGMATMLAVVTTDADLPASALQLAVDRAVAATFNRADSDGCMSTNDTVILLASGASGVTPDPDEFGAAVTRVCADLARQMVGDAEGAQHDIAVRVVNAETEQAAEAVARAVARSNLFKTAVFGQDPNWGRVISAVGTVPESVAAFDSTALDVSFNGVQVCRASGVGEDRSLVDLSAREVRVEIDLHAGDVEATIWTNDLTHDYVHENSAYST